ncbi:hypothetical protein CHUV2995_02141 [Corynebacterium diphtheriae subsp. lausannense]|nr:hypothetical protein CHUV2995_02141 [Corynebacterium diphtheriae subsp. lausannense]
MVVAFIDRMRAERGGPDDQRGGASTPCYGRARGV